ncbi:FHA domain-containing protein [Myxococcus stipitatus]|uniref:FHA domain-containing protein n=1 Tax=Myxococcus stipitatus TaxID=83455 RepID=UPI001F2044B2|nr:FHA domain-containing protein [Myxococcus stipitatus]MCE9672467.1 FHA domain-containing protein [Myxococcus stipitatus]
MATLVVRLPDGTENEHDISGELKLGRQQGSDILLTEGGVSRTHARVFSEGGTVFIEDLGSANGTFVNGERIAEPTALTPQAEVVLGDYTLRLKAASGAARGSGPRKAAKPADAVPVGTEAGGARATRAIPSIKAKPAGAAPGAALAKRPARPVGGAPAAGGGAAGPLLRGMLGPWAGKTYPLKGKVMVGRVPPAGIVLEDDSVSRKHAELEASGGAVYVRDLGSANGTLLNGEPLGADPVDLQPGDVLQFGVVEFEFESSSDAVPKRGASAGGRGRPGAGAEEGGDARRKKLLVVGGAVVGLLVLGGIAKSMTGGAGAVAPSGPVGVAGPQDTTAQLQDLLSECRSFASSELGAPNWEKAEQTCSKALDLDPINSEGNSLIRRIRLEKAAFENFSQGEKLMGRLKPEEALVYFRKIPKESEYYRRSRAKSTEAEEQVTKRSLEDCRRYLRDSQWSAAVPRCQTYMEVWCKGQSRDDLQPPLGFTLKLEGRLRKNEWRPKDALFVKFLSARYKLEPNPAPWVCPQRDDDLGPTVVDPKTAVAEAARQRYPNKLMQAAMMDYWSGRGSEALATLQKLRANYENAQYHAAADEMMKTMSTVDQLFKAGQSYLAADDPEKAADPLREALDVDKSLMMELAESKPSFYRRNILADMADKSYQRGKHWADRDDKRRACRMWKLGFGFYAGNPDLNKAAGFCSTMALNTFRGAGGCPDLAAALDFAVKGDGVEELVVEKKKELGCP